MATDGARETFDAYRSTRRVCVHPYVAADRMDLVEGQRSGDAVHGRDSVQHPGVVVAAQLCPRIGAEGDLRVPAGVE
jgi:hypothetical protein